MLKGTIHCSQQNVKLSCTAAQAAKKIDIESTVHKHDLIVYINYKLQYTSKEEVLHSQKVCVYTHNASNPRDLHHG